MRISSRPITLRPITFGLLAVVIAGGILSSTLLEAFPNAVSPTITTSASTVLANQAITVTGAGFSTSGAAIVASATLDSVAISTDKINAGTKVEIAKDGRVRITAWHSPRPA